LKIFGVGKKRKEKERKGKEKYQREW